MGHSAINFRQKFGLLAEQWQPKVVAEINDYQFKIVRLQGDFIWHRHAETDEACQKLEGAHGQRLTAKDHVDATMAAGGHANFEMKWAGPDGVVIDISHTGWEGTD